MGNAIYGFIGDTRVLTPDGKNPTFNELVDSGVKELTVYATVKHGDRYNIHLAKAVNPRITQYATEYIPVEVTGEVSDRDWFFCTQEHLIRLSNGNYRKAKELKKGDYLMSLPCFRYGLWADIKWPYVVLTVVPKHSFLDGPTEVYGLTVPKYENFAIALENGAGIFVRDSIREEQ